MQAFVLTASYEEQYHRLMERYEKHLLDASDLLRVSVEDQTGLPEAVADADILPPEEEQGGELHLDLEQEPAEAANAGELLQLDRISEEKNLPMSKEAARKALYYRGDVMEGLPHGRGKMVKLDAEQLQQPPRKAAFNPLPAGASSAGVWSRGLFSGALRVNSKVKLFYLDGIVVGFSFSSRKYVLQCYLEIDGGLDMPYDWDGDVTGVTNDRLNGVVFVQSEHYPKAVFLPLFEGFIFDSRVKFHWTGAAFYRGDLVERKISGTGRMLYFSGYYEGQWVNGRRHGLGIESFEADGKTVSYIGEFKDNLKQGSGIMQVAVRDMSFKLMSNWERGYPNGESVLEALNQKYRGKLRGNILVGDGFSCDFNFPFFDNFFLVATGNTNHLNEPAGFTSIKWVNLHLEESKELRCFWPQDRRGIVIVEDYQFGEHRYTGAIRDARFNFSPASLMQNNSLYHMHGLGISVNCRSGAIREGFFEGGLFTRPLDLSRLTFEDLVDLDSLFFHMSQSLDLSLI